MSEQQIKVGDEIHLQVKGVTNDRVYQTAGEVIEIIPPHFGKVRYRQPWARPHNCMRVTMVDLRIVKRIKRRKRT